MPLYSSLKTRKDWCCSHLLGCLCDASVPVTTFAQHPFEIVKGGSQMTGTLKATQAPCVSGLALV